MTITGTRRCGVCNQPGHNSRTCSQKALIRDSENTPPPINPNPGTQHDLGLLKIDYEKIFITLLPSEATSVIVKYEPKIQVSCVIPPQQFPAAYSYSRRNSMSSRAKKVMNITTPTLIMSCGYGDIPTFQTYKRVQSPHTLWALDSTRSESLWVKPYIFSNVYVNGNICFGALYPHSLRQAYNHYWTSGFNAELLFESEREIPHNCDKKNHQRYYHQGHKCDPSKKIHICECPKVTFHTHNTSSHPIGPIQRNTRNTRTTRTLGCGCHTLARSKKCRGTCDNSEESRCVCCKAIKDVRDAALLVSPNLSQRKINKLAILEGEDAYHGCGCLQRHKSTCPCANPRTCSCVCVCACCTKTCEHDECTCTCCRDTCACGCGCSADQRYNRHLTNYNNSNIHKQAWRDRSSLFCGKSFWASPRGASGVLLSQSKLLLQAIPKSFWRKGPGGIPFIVTLATRKQNGNWKCESGGFAFELEGSNVFAK